MNLKLEIRCNATLQVVTDVWKDWDYNTYWWEEGNSACDCNRSLFFARALGLPEPEETLCSDERYSVRLSDNDTKEILYDEFSTTSGELLALKIVGRELDMHLQTKEVQDFVREAVNLVVSSGVVK